MKLIKCVLIRVANATSLKPGGSAAPDTRCNARRRHPEPPHRSHVNLKRCEPEPSSSKPGIARPTKRLGRAAVPRGGKRAAPHRSSPVCPGATPTSGSSRHTMETTSLRLRARMHQHLKTGRSKTPGFIPTPHPLALHGRRSRAARRIRLLPPPRGSFSGERCRRDPLTPHSQTKTVHTHWWLDSPGAR